MRHRSPRNSGVFFLCFESLSKLSDYEIEVFSTIGAYKMH